MTTRDNSQQVMVDLIKVSKIYSPGVQALVDVSLTVHTGEMVFLTGMSGAGKTTLLRLLSRIETADKGLVEVNGMDLDKLSRNKIQHLRRRIGVAYQDFRMLPRQTVAQNIAISMEVSYRKKSFIRRQTRELLERLHLSDKYNTPAADLSRGEQQRVSIARALANKPELILADEPTGNLDSETTILVMDLFNEHNRRGATLIIASHDQSIFQETGHRVVELRAGRIFSVQEATAREEDFTRREEQEEA